MQCSLFPCTRLFLSSVFCSLQSNSLTAVCSHCECNKQMSQHKSIIHFCDRTDRGANYNVTIQEIIEILLTIQTLILFTKTPTV